VDDFKIQITPHIILSKEDARLSKLNTRLKTKAFNNKINIS